MDFCPEVMQQKLQLDVQAIQPSDNIAQFRVDVLKKTLLKKYVQPGNDVLLHQAAIKSFVDRNEKLSDKFNVPESRSGLMAAWQNRIYDTLMSGEYQSSVLTLNSCFLLGKPGPGSTRGTRFTDFYRKMWTSDYTYTNELLVTHFESSLPERWKQANITRRQLHSNRQVIGSSLTSVPKDSKKNRCICTEPSINMFYQLGAHSVLSHVLVRHFNLDIRFQQVINKNAAQRGSVDGLSSTIDLSDASDHIHYDLIKQLVPPEIFRTLDLIRSPSFRSDIGSFRFNMISSMGNGFTFAFMTYLLVSLLDVFLVTKGDRYTPLRDGVFGDDIILPTRYYDEFTQVLSDFGFKVNLDKSFSTGFFRESCGGDFYYGHNVRGVYIRSLTNEAEVYSAFNRLFDWSVRTGIHLNHLLLYVKGLAQFRPVPRHEADDSGFRIPYEFVQGAKRDSNGAVYYRPLVTKPNKFRINEKSPNHFGAYISALGGFVRGQSVSFRYNGKVRYKVDKRKTPNWDFTTCPELNAQEVRMLWLALVAS